MPSSSAATQTCPDCGHCMLSGSTGHLDCRGCRCRGRHEAPGVFLVPRRDARCGIAPGTRGYLSKYENGGEAPDARPSDWISCGRPLLDYFGAFPVAECTRFLGHSDDHANYGGGGAMVARWTEGARLQRNTRECPSCRRTEGEPVTFWCSEPRCQEGGWCASCCPCNSVPYRDQTGSFYGDPSTRFPRFVGVEVECGKLPGAKVSGYRHVRKVADKYGLRIGSDGSITNFRSATEISTPPTRGDAFANLVKELGEALIADDLKANPSCGFHVHVDVRDYESKHLLAFIWLYTQVEKALYKIVARSRRENHYSRMWGDQLKDAGILDMRRTIPERMRRLNETLYGSAQAAEDMRRSRSKHGSRYHGVNFNAIYVHGTIEFRLHHGTVNPVKMTMWSAVCSALVEHAFRHSEEEIRSSDSCPAGRYGNMLERIVADPEVISWVRARRLLFANDERARRGIAPIKRVTKEPRRSPPIQILSPGEIELSEGIAGS